MNPCSRILPLVLVLIVPSALQADWQLQYECVYGPHAPDCGPNPGPISQTHPSLFRTKVECEAASTQCDPILDHSGDGCDHSLTGSQNKMCTCLFPPCDEGSTGGGGGGTEDIASIPGSEFLPPGTLLTDSQFEQIAGGLHSLGDLSMMGTEYGDAFFTPRYTLSTNDWIQQSQDRWQAYLEGNRRVREEIQAGRAPRLVMSPFGDGISNAPLTTQTFETEILDQALREGISPRTEASDLPVLKEPVPMSLKDDNLTQLTAGDMGRLQDEAGAVGTDPTMEQTLVDAAMKLPQSAVESQIDPALQTGGEAVLEKYFGDGAGEPLGDALSATKVAQKVQEGDYTGAAVEAVNWGVGKIPLPGISVGQAGGQVVSGVAKEALLGAFTMMNTAVGAENPRERAEESFEAFKQEATPGQKMVIDYLGW